MKQAKYDTFLGRKLAEVRTRKKWSRYQTAKAAGIGLQTYLNIEDGRVTNTGWEIIQRLADALGVPTDTFRETQTMP